jgi:hypothetical protein
MATWVKLAGARDCKGESCPAIHLSDDGRLFVQGRRASAEMRNAIALAADEDAVEVTSDLLQEALETLRLRGHVH